MTDLERIVVAGATLLNEQSKIYLLLHPESTSKGGRSLNVMNARYLRKPEVAQFIRAVKAMIGQGSTTAGKTESIDLSTKDNVLAELQRLYLTTADPAKKASVLKQISDLQQLKTESTSEQERIHLYLPATCDICPYNPENNQDK